ncbi:hypothetical protein [Streptomyces lateritius]|uniref:hypothetical protein n=1 Tax=Streptomyces lateritius TaxID=67313 RepID=UPI00167962B3|nr:hypothetical protein [Streptomyces lateritius]GGU12852.1 hypothetical protein GCM10010272_67590 [Streptomyces lateritius]
MALTQTSLTPTPAGSPLTPFLLFRAGNWTTTPFQFPAPSAEVDDDTHLKKLGFDPWTATEGLTASADMLPLAL